MCRQPEPRHLDLLVRGYEVVEHGLPGFPLASALIDQFHDQTEGARHREGDGHGEQPLARFRADIHRAGIVQKEKADDDRGDRGDRAYQRQEGQPTVRLTHMRSLLRSGPLCTTRIASPPHRTRRTIWSRPHIPQR